MRPVIMFVLGALLLCLSPSSALARVSLLVTNTADSGPGSLREAILAANSHSDGEAYIDFVPGGYPQNGTIQLLTALPVLTKRHVLINGREMNPRIHAHAGSTTAILNASDTVEYLGITGMRFEDGRSNSSGGCIAAGGSNIHDPVLAINIVQSEFRNCWAIAEDETSTGGGAIAIMNLYALVRIQDSLFSGNRVMNGAKGFATGSGGAIRFSGEYLTIENSRFFSNRAEMVFASGGAISTGNRLKQLVVRGTNIANNRAVSEGTPSHGGAISTTCFEDCALFIESNFFSDNSAGHGGAAYLRRGTAGDRVQLELTNNTFHANQASESGGALRLGTVDIYMQYNTFVGNNAASGAHLAISTSVLDYVSHNALGHSNGSGTACQVDPAMEVATITNHNAFVDATCSGKLQPGAVLLPDLGSYELNFGGSIPVIAFAQDSPLTDGGGVSGLECYGTDARGTARPLDGDGDGIARCDIGAYERPDPYNLFADGFEP